MNRLQFSLRTLLILVLIAAVLLYPFTWTILPEVRVRVPSGLEKKPIVTLNTRTSYALGDLYTLRQQDPTSEHDGIYFFEARTVRECLPWHLLREKPILDAVSISINGQMHALPLAELWSTKLFELPGPDSAR